MEDCKNICVNTSRTCEWYVVENKDADKQKQNRNCQKNTYTHNIGLMKIKPILGFFCHDIKPGTTVGYFSQTEKNSK